jgi:hypothetical protein
MLPMGGKPRFHSAYSHDTETDSRPAEHQKLSDKPDLKGHGFSRAAKTPKNAEGFSPCGTFLALQTLLQGLKPYR